MNSLTMPSTAYDILEMPRTSQKELPTSQVNWTKEAVRHQVDLPKSLAQKRQSTEQRPIITSTICQISLLMSKDSNRHCDMRSLKQSKGFSNRLTLTKTVTYHPDRLIILLKKSFRKWEKISLSKKMTFSLSSTSWTTIETEKSAKQRWLTLSWTFSTRCDHSLIEYVYTYFLSNFELYCYSAL